MFAYPNKMSWTWIIGKVHPQGTKRDEHMDIPRMKHIGCTIEMTSQQMKGNNSTMNMKDGTPPYCSKYVTFVFSGPG